MKYLLDTNICIFVIKKKPACVLNHFLEHMAGDLGVSSVTVAELRYGAEKSARAQQNHLALDVFLAPLIVVDFDATAARHCGEVRDQLERGGIPIGPLDTMIAAHSLSLDVTLITSNTSEFARVSGLRIENWAEN